MERLSDTIVCHIIIIKELHMGANPADVVVDKTLISEVKNMMLDLIWNGKSNLSSTIKTKALHKPNLTKILECAKAHPDTWRVVEVTDDNFEDVKATNGFDIAKVGDIVAYFKPALNVGHKSTGIVSVINVKPNKIKLVVHKAPKKHGRFMVA